MFFQMGDPAPGPNLRMQCIDKTLALYAVGHKCERSTIPGEEEPPPSMQLMLDDAERLFQWCTKDPRPEPTPSREPTKTPIENTLEFLSRFSDEGFEQVIEQARIRRAREKADSTSAAPSEAIPNLTGVKE